MTSAATDLDATMTSGAVSETQRVTRETNPGDRAYRAVMTGLALLLPAVLLVLLAELVVNSWPAITTFGLDFVLKSTWNPVTEVYGAAPLIFGTLASSFLALVIAVPLALSAAIFMTEFSPHWVRSPLGFLIELLAAVPSVVYGLWGIFVLIPFLRTVVVPPLKAVFGWLPFFQGAFYGSSMLAAGIILAVMIVPYIAAVSREVLSAVPGTQREAALALGATRWEAVRMAVLPYGRAGIMGAIMLGLGRALGETMAVTIILSVSGIVTFNLISQANPSTIAANIALDFPESSGLAVNTLIASGLVLFAITLVANLGARAIVARKKIE
jgi:phosphate transport system permease protein